MWPVQRMRVGVLIHMSVTCGLGRRRICLALHRINDSAMNAVQVLDEMLPPRCFIFIFIHYTGSNEKTQTT